MAILPIYTYGSDVLKKKAQPITAVDNEIVRLAMDMLDTMYNANGAGLAANQVGVLKRILVFDIKDFVPSKEDETVLIPTPRPPEASKPMILINPEVIEASGEWSLEEGCLSIPDVRERITRPETVRIRYRDINFEEQEFAATRLLSRVALHEIDHLNGTLITDRLPKTKQLGLKPHLRRLMKGDFDADYPVTLPSPRK